MALHDDLSKQIGKMWENAVSYSEVRYQHLPRNPE